MVPSHGAFFSYSHLDDEHDDGRLSALREQLSHEVRAQSGEAFPIFQDRDGVAWGEQWRNRLSGAVDSATFLIPVITPCYCRSTACLEEIARFLERERVIGRTDLVLPIYYIESPQAAWPGEPAQHQLIARIFERQYDDWRALRFSETGSAVVREHIASMATRIREAIGRAASPAVVAPPVPYEAAALAMAEHRSVFEEQVKRVTHRLRKDDENVT